MAGVAIGWLFPAQLATLLGSSGVVHEMSTTYLQVLMTFAPCFLFSNILIAFMRNDNAPLFSTICMVTGTVTNIVLDYVFMYPLGMGIFGAALATGVLPAGGHAHGAGAVRPAEKSHVPSVRCPLRPRLLAWCCALGMSSFIGEVSSAVVTLVSNNVIEGLAGDVGVAAYGVIANLSFAVLAVFIGIARAASR